MVRDDDFFLHKWVEYYGRELGRENLFILFDGEDQTVPDFCSDLHTRVHVRQSSNIVKGDHERIGLISEKTRELFAEGYDIVIGVDCDEFIVADPSTGMSLQEFISTREIGISVSPLGIDMGQNLDCENEINPDSKFLEQRHYGYLSTRYTKASVLGRPEKWGSGFHRVMRHNFHICPDLYLFHFGCLDMQRMRERFMNPQRVDNTWERHFSKRAKTLSIVTAHPARDFDRWTDIARRLQTIIRPVYAWNKPAMLGLTLVVEIPERFRDIL